MTSKISSNSIANILGFLPYIDMSKFAQTNKDCYKIYKKEQKKKNLN